MKICYQRHALLFHMSTLAHSFDFFVIFVGNNIQLTVDLNPSQIQGKSSHHPALNSTYFLRRLSSRLI